MQQCRNHGRIHPAGQAKDNFVTANLVTYFLNRFVNYISGSPQSFASTYLVHEASQNISALAGMRYLGMELQPVVLP